MIGSVSKVVPTEGERTVCGEARARRISRGRVEPQVGAVGSNQRDVRASVLVVVAPDHVQDPACQRRGLRQLVGAIRLAFVKLHRQSFVAKVIEAIDHGDPIFDPVAVEVNECTRLEDAAGFTRQYPSHLF